MASETPVSHIDQKKYFTDKNSSKNSEAHSGQTSKIGRFVLTIFAKRPILDV